jgi:mono/diheme cytochrome c family protein
MLGSNVMLAGWQRSLALLAVLLSLPLAAAEKSSAKVDYQRDVRPIISAKCYHCHGPDDGAREAKLRFDIREEAVKERKGGTFAIKPGDVKRSELVARISTSDPDELMPPPKTGHPLTKEEVETLKRWVQQGAPYADHWAFTKPVAPAIPKTSASKAWAKNEVDYFIHQKLKEAKLSPNAEADKHTLVRRLSLDLIGLPPTPQEVEAFVNDKSVNAYEKLVDRLLASPHFGEKWARMWLDLARYADSAGYGSDPLRMNIWPYRDWVINAFNRNLPYNQFTIEQLAGDLLPNATPEQMTATAFHRNTMTNTEGGTDDEEFRVAAVKDRVGTTMQVWMGLTMNCAQCHTHKYDPISQKEYYQFYAFFNQTEDSDKPDEYPTMPLPSADETERTAKIQTEIAALEKQFSITSPELLDELAAWEKAQKTGVAWATLNALEAKSRSGSELNVQSDQSILAAGEAADADVYTVKWRLNGSGVTALRLEVLPDDSLPAKGPGRASGNFVLNDVKLTVKKSDAQVPAARYVRIELPGKQKILSLAEVQVFSGGQNVAQGKAAKQSSTSYDALASYAVDGNTDGKFDAKSTTHNQTEDNPWWEVDLGTSVAVERVAVWNRTDGNVGGRLAGFRIVALDANRKTVWENTVPEAPKPKAEIATNGERTVLLKNASADHSQGDFEVAKAIDTDKKTGWAVASEFGKPHAAVFELASPLTEGEGAVITLTLDQSYGTKHLLGKFRLQATTQKTPVRELSKEVLAVLVVDATKRTEAQRKTLLDYYRPMSVSLAKVNAQLAQKRKDLAAIKPLVLPVMKELGAEKKRSTHLFNKGNFLDPGAEVQPEFLARFAPPKAEVPRNRLGVAEWLVSRDNPLTARVQVNRLWSQLFGRGLVLTEEDFGTQGTLPSHPELLDYLSVEFMTKGWDMKGMIKTMVMSATYRQSSVVSEKSAARDPQNILLSHYPRRRLDAEGVRDQALALSGLLSGKIGGPSVYPPQPDGLWRAAFNGQRSWSTSAGEDRYRRGLYTFWRRTVPYPSMATFDAPSRENCTLRRLPTNTPLQAFVTLNDPAFVEMSQALGRRIQKEGGSTLEERVKYALTLCLARPAQAEQVKALVELYQSELEHYRKDTESAKKLAIGADGKAGAGDTAEQAAWTVVGNVLLNLDGVLTKG